MRQIEIVGMRKNRDLKIVITIIILAIISIIVCVGIIIYNKQKVIETSAGLSGDSNNAVAVADDKKEDDETSDSNETQDDEKDSQEETQESNDAVVDEKTKNFVNQVNNIYNGEEGKRVFLTFDDGPTEEVTTHILDILDKYNIKATFFVLGNRVKANPEILQREYNSGHYIANHGYSHKYSKIYKSVDSILDEYNKTEQAIRDALGNQEYSSHLFRFPGGSHGGPYEKIKKKARKELNEKGIAYIDWSALTYDAEGAKTEKEILKNLKETMNGWDNVVILMHDSADKKVTYESLEAVIKYLQEKGYAFKNMYDLMN